MFIHSIAVQCCSESYKFSDLFTRCFHDIRIENVE
jgi:hypothetical protein